MSYERPAHVILEIECGDYPFPRLGNRKPVQGELYVGLDTFAGMSSEDVAATAQGVQYILSRAIIRQMSVVPLGSVQMVRGDSSELPFRDGTVDEVVAVDVFGNRENYARHGQVALEAARVLRQSGQLTVVETRSPRPLDASPAESVPGLRGLMREAGLVQANRGLEQLNAAGVAEYAHPSSRLRWGDPEARDYIAIFMHSAAFEHDSGV